MTKKQQDLLRKKLQEKRRALVAAYITNKNYGRDTEDGDTQDIADKASNAYTKEFLYSLSNTDRQMLKMVDEALARLKHGTYGIWIRATTQDRIMAAAMGIPVPWVHTAVFAIGAGMAAASGVLFGPLGGVTQTMGADFTLRTLIVVVVGGMGNLGGSILASLFISMLEAYASLFVSPAQAVIVSFVALILTLLFRPTGLFVPTQR